jgi:hypothetical protein
MGLLKTGLKAAVAVKTADVIHQRILDRQEEHAAAHGHAVPAAEAAPPAAVITTSAPPAPGSPDMTDKLAQLKQLGELRTSGVLTDSEFEVQKLKILSL